MMFSIKCYVNEQDIPPELCAAIRDVLVNEQHISIKQSWEQGYHLELFGLLEQHQAESYRKLFDKILKKNPSQKYDPEQFKQKYQKIASFFQKQDALDTVRQNEVVVTRLKDTHVFENQEQLSLYLHLHKVFDTIYNERYFQNNNILSITQDIFAFSKQLPATVLSSEQAVYSDGFVSHLSHYLGFIHSLQKDDRRQVHTTFWKKAKKDASMFSDEEAKHRNIAADLQPAYARVCQYIEEGKLTFYSPRSEERFLAGLKKGTERHAAMFRDEKLREIVIRDPVLCTNRWVLNVLYEKLVLMRIKPLEKFYMNFLISKYKYERDLQEVL